MVNLTEGILSKIMTDILQDALKNEGVHRNLHQREKQGRTMREEFLEDRKAMTAGRIFKHGKVLLDSKVLECQELKQTKKDTIEREKGEKFVKEYKEKKRKYEEVMKLALPPASLSNEQLKAVCAFKKRKGDKAIPTVKKLLLERYNETIVRHDLPLSQWMKDNNHKMPEPLLIVENEVKVHLEKNNESDSEQALL